MHSASLLATAAAARHAPCVRVSVIKADGSTPRGVGAAMRLGVDDIADTIGGGALELEAIRHARALLATSGSLRPWHRETRDFALGPSLGQCCGGATRLLFEVWTAREAALLDAGPHEDVANVLAVRPLAAGRAAMLVASRKADLPDVPLPVVRAARDMLSGVRPRQASLIAPGKGAGAWFVEPAARCVTPLYLYGAGHVGRAIVHVLQGLPFHVHWVDTSRDRFPSGIPEDIEVIAAHDPANVAAHTPAGAIHLVLTFSHALDLAIVFALLQRADAALVGLIGSDTKAARFRKRLRDAGIGDAALARLTCPIGIRGLSGKEPPVIAVSVAAQLIELLEAQGAESLVTGARGA